MGGVRHLERRTHRNSRSGVFSGIRKHASKRSQERRSGIRRIPEWTSDREFLPSTQRRCSDTSETPQAEERDRERDSERRRREDYRKATSSSIGTRPCVQRCRFFFFFALVFAPVSAGKTGLFCAGFCAARAAFLEVNFPCPMPALSKKGNYRREPAALFLGYSTPALLGSLR